MKTYDSYWYSCLVDLLNFSITFLSVFKFFEQRNQKLRGHPMFVPGTNSSFFVETRTANIRYRLANNPIFQLSFLRGTLWTVRGLLRIEVWRWHTKVTFENVTTSKAISLNRPGLFTVFQIWAKESKFQLKRMHSVYSSVKSGVKYCKTRIICFFILPQTIWGREKMAYGVWTYTPTLPRKTAKRSLVFRISLHSSMR
jgi:hypothetical protein